MTVQIVAPKVGQIWISPLGTKYTIIKVDLYNAYDLRPNGTNGVFASIYDDGKMHIVGNWTLVGSKPKKIIPDIPLDPSLPILEAGHLQDRARKKYK